MLLFSQKMFLHQSSRGTEALFVCAEQQYNGAVGLQRYGRFVVPPCLDSRPCYESGLLECRCQWTHRPGRPRTPFCQEGRAHSSQADPNGTPRGRCSSLAGVRKRVRSEKANGTVARERRLSGETKRKWRGGLTQSSLEFNLLFRIHVLPETHKHLSQHVLIHWLLMYGSYVNSRTLFPFGLSPSCLPLLSLCWWFQLSPETRTDTCPKSVWPSWVR